MNPNKALWGKRRLHSHRGEHARERGRLVESFGITRGLKVLDLGCGDGHDGSSRGKKGCGRLGVDIAKNLVDAGNRRAQEAGLTNCRFQEGDATNLTRAGGAHSFDLVVSVFGVMFAPKPFDVAKEMVRVARVEGRVIMGNWIRMIRRSWRRS